MARAQRLRRMTTENAWLAEVRTEHSDYFPALPCQSHFNRRTRWLWGTFEQLPAPLADRLPVGDWQQIDTTALPVEHLSRRPDSWYAPTDFVAKFGRDGPHNEWFYGFRLGLRTDPGSRLVRALGHRPRRRQQSKVAGDLLSGTDASAGLLLDRGFFGRDFTA
ncbi:hypothetical protein [Nocardia brasiliensis]|uniref:hypothetical protein n=1 Tax=Nocardia brasiliensis TaxID=37326 RepID=UPI00366B83EF